MYCYVGYFVYFFFYKRIQCCVGDSYIIVLNNGKFIDFYFQLFMGMVYQNVLLFQWVDKFQNIVNIVDGGVVDLFGVFYDDLCIDIIM